MKKKRAIIPLIILIVICIVSSIFLMRVYTLGGDLDQKTEKVTLSPGEIDDSDVCVSLVKNEEKRWYNAGKILMGAQFDGVIQNTTFAEISEWKVTIDVPKGSYIDSSWNGIYELSNGKITILPPPDFNKYIPSEGSITFGFIMYAPPDYEMTNYTISYFRVSDYRESPLFWGAIFVLCLAGGALITYVALIFRISSFQKKEQEDLEFIERTMKLFANTIEAKDLYTKGHSLRVSIYAKEIARRAGFDEKSQQIVYYSAILHDIGKIGVPDPVLNKAGKLTDDERIIIQTHAAIGSKILTDFDLVPNIANIVRHHHEHFNGNGYPDKLIGAEIPIESRIICIADSFDAMTSSRCYRKKLNISSVIQELTRCNGTQFDPDLLPFLISMVQDGSAPVL